MPTSPPGSAGRGTRPTSSRRACWPSSARPSRRISRRFRTGIAWPALHWCLAPETPPADALGPDGHAAKGGFLPPVPLPRRMWAGGSDRDPRRTCAKAICVTRTETVRDVAFKEGRSGTLCFVTVDHAVATGPRRRDPRTAGHRLSRGGRVRRPGRRCDARARRSRRLPRSSGTVPATPTLLFRYSAMTFNGHRFHYDQPYATQVEGYADLVVHGPMQATLADEPRGHAARARAADFRVSRRVADDGQPDLPGLRPDDRRPRSRA